MVVQKVLPIKDSNVLHEVEEVLYPVKVTLKKIKN